MAALALAVVAIALPDSLNPTLIVGAVYLALGSHPVRRTLAFTISAFVVTLLGGLLIALGLGDLILSALPKLSRAVKWETMTIVGAALVFGAGLIWWRRGSLADSEPPSRRKPADAAREGGSAVLMGGGIAGVEFLTAFPYFAAIAMVLGASVSAAGKLFLLVLYNLIYVLPLIAIVISCAVMGEEGGRRLAPIGDWIAMRWPTVVAPMVGAVGVGLTVCGIVQLS